MAPARTRQGAPRRRAVLAAGAALGLGAVWPAAAVATAAPGTTPAATSITVLDGLGRRIQLAAPAQRIVTIFSSNTELVSSLGLLTRIVGVEDYTRFPPEVRDLPKVGGRLGFSVDAVVARAPDLVIVTPARQAAHQLVEPMERIGVPVMVLLSRTLAEVIDNVQRVALAAGVPGRGRALAEALQERLRVVDRRTAGRARPRVLMITGRMGNGMLLVARPRSYTGEAIVRAGAHHALPQLGALAQVSPEAALTSDPDALLFAGTQAGLDELLRRPGWRNMRAVRERRVSTVERAQFLIPGPRTFDGIESLAHWLHGTSADAGARSAA